MEKVNQKKIESMENWRNEHGTPDFGYLQSLVQDGEHRAHEKLHAIADDLNVTYDQNTTPNELLDQIRLMVQTGPHNTT